MWDADTHIVLRRHIELLYLRQGYTTGVVRLHSVESVILNIHVLVNNVLISMLVIVNIMTAELLLPVLITLPTQVQPPECTLTLLMA